MEAVLDYKRIVEGNNPEDPAALKISAASTEAIKAGLEQLPPHQKEVLELRAAGSSYREIAEAMELSDDGLAMSRLYYAQRALAAILSAEGIS